MKTVLAKILRRAAFLGAVIVTVGTLSLHTADAQVTEDLGTFDAWQAKSFTDASGSLVCFMQSVPASRSENKKRGTIAFFITHWQGDKSRNVVSVAAGYAYKKGSRPTVTIDGQVFRLAEIAEQKSAEEREMAWSEDQATDDAIVAALQKGSTLVVDGVSQRGTETKDTYSLKGSAEAYKAISTKCAI